MTRNRKGRAGWHQATLKTSKHTCHSTGIGCRVKAAVVTLAVWGWFPIGLAQRINRMGGTHDE
ncbi:Fe-S oxidoreductase [Thiohalobacter thiocyanaticus]|uniref:Fe-S oxidoreductase n=1 Tax=Thiohalobacter thiocyanaticus TaxID=585455 RepID=A0A1Z4VR03_9GAMM|nr:Fe-S oxidoreductase [Thiohalobacter thiocyanaticus]